MATDTEDDKQPSLRDMLSSAFDEADDAPTQTFDDGPSAQVETATDDDANLPAVVDTGKASGQPRDDQGRWTKAEIEAAKAEGRELPAEKPQAAPNDPGTAQGKGGGVVLAPPPGWAPAAKAAYKDLPAVVQTAIAQREEEVNRGFQKMQDYKGLDRHAETARANGTTLAEAFDRYVAAENVLETDFKRGVFEFCRMFNYHPMKLANEFAAMFGQAPRNVQRGGQQQQLPAAASPELALITRELSAMRQQFSQLSEAQNQQADAEINSVLADFAKDHIYYENVRHEMGRLIKEGLATSLEQAYDDACWSNREIRPLLIKEQSAPKDQSARVDQHRRAAGSLPAGSPLPGVKPGAGNPPNSLRGALLEAWDGAASI